MRMTGQRPVRRNRNKSLASRRPRIMDQCHKDTVDNDCNEGLNSLAMALYYHLPRELRNRVYTYCVQGIYDNEVIIRRPAHANGSTRFLVRDCTGPPSYRWIDDPINSIIKDPILGDLVAREMLEAYYWTRRFKLSHRELPILNKVLGEDTFGFGMTPACYLRHLHVQVHMGSAKYSKLSEVIGLEEEDSLRAIQDLAIVLTTRTEVTLDFSFLGHVDDNDDYPLSPANTERMLIKLGPVINMLKESQLRVAVTHEKLWGD
ncbi:hypothetical protein BDU57DRAFT_116902 [Ampelomyces quisqualis]|uniref:Uncharacterized protein n=1 Tax=Ampelomyces quisqualis TaxID=50730 RepID=A0A6A5QSH1_AMPQU|nr:hypothetical protein BDU57DRAFT_116902 [Ampelomyces quisqualis]